MPTYEYVCTRDESHRVEVFQRIGDPPLETCEECGGALRKVFHPVGVVLKGSGFYKTDSRSTPSGKEPEEKKEKEKEKEKAPAKDGAKKAEPSGGASTKDGKGKS